jgi:enoyl-CoA hydratase/carnithine racemase
MKANNALCNAMYRAATEALDEAQKSQEIASRCLAAKAMAFTAGNDLADLANTAAGKAEELAALGFIEALGRAEKLIGRSRPRPCCWRFYRSAGF